MSDEDEQIGDFQEFEEDSGESEEPNEEEILSMSEEISYLENRVADLENRLQFSPEENPLDLDPRIGVKDVAFDRAKPGAKVYVVASLADTVENYYEAFPDAPRLDEYAGNVITSFTDEDAVFAVVYVKDSLTSVDTNLTAYPMPATRLTRFPAEQASLIGEKDIEFTRTNVPGEHISVPQTRSVPCGCGDYRVHVPVRHATPSIDVVCPECGNHFGQDEPSEDEAVETDGGEDVEEISSTRLSG